MLENVPGLLTTRKGIRDFNERCNGLEDLDDRLSYDIGELAEYGVPQFRKRLVLLAAHGKAITIPTPTHRAPARAGKSGQHPWRTVRGAIGNLPTTPLRSVVKSKKVVPRYDWHYSRDIAKE